MIKCSGCGVELQDKNKDLLGYTTDIKTGLCMRCFRLFNYGEYKDVSMGNSDYLKILKQIPKDNLVVYVVDILSFNLDLLKNFNNVLLVVTKGDIIPRNVKIDRLVERIKRECSAILDVVVVSSIRNNNMDTLYRKIVDYSRNSSVYLVGNTNTGKSTLLNKLIKNYSNSSDKVTVSMYPSTTLGEVSVDLGDVTIIDTPGIIDDGSIINYVDKFGLKKILPKKEIRPRSVQISNSGSMIIDEYVRIDYDTSCNNSIVIYCSPSLKVGFNQLNNDKLKDLDKVFLNIDKKCDIVIPGLGFIKCMRPIMVTVYVISGTLVYVRDNLI